LAAQQIQYMTNHNNVIILFLIEINANIHVTTAISKIRIS